MAGPSVGGGAVSGYQPDTAPHKWPLCQPVVARCVARNTPRLLGWWSAGASQRLHQVISAHPTRLITVILLPARRGHLP